MNRVPLSTRLFIKSMLQRDPKDRLLQADLNYDAIRGHAFFSKFDWDKLEKRQLAAPPISPETPY